jgi:hypothetical protein
VPNKTNYNNNIIEFPIPTHERLFDNCVNPKRTIEGAAALVEQPVQKMKNINIKVTNLEKLRIIKSAIKDLIPGKKYGISEKKKTEFCKMISITVQDLEESIDTE